MSSTRDFFSGHGIGSRSRKSPLHLSFRLLSQFFVRSRLQTLSGSYIEYKGGVKQTLPLSSFLYHRKKSPIVSTSRQKEKIIPSLTLHKDLSILSWSPVVYQLSCLFSHLLSFPLRGLHRSSLPQISHLSRTPSPHTTEI